MIVKPRDDYNAIADSISPAVGSDATDLRAQREYDVLFLGCHGGSAAYVYLDMGKPYAEVFDLRLFHIIDASLPRDWQIGLSRMGGSGLYATLLGPQFWVSDYHWYERLLDNDTLARQEYAAYLNERQRKDG